MLQVETLQSEAKNIKLWIKVSISHTRKPCSTLKQRQVSTYNQRCGIWRWNNVETTSGYQPIINVEDTTLKQRWNNVVQRHDQNSTMFQRWSNVVCLLGTFLQRCIARSLDVAYNETRMQRTFYKRRVHVAYDATYMQLPNNVVWMLCVTQPRRNLDATCLQRCIARSLDVAYNETRMQRTQPERNVLQTSCTRCVWRNLYATLQQRCVNVVCNAT